MVTAHRVEDARLARKCGEVIGAAFAEDPVSVWTLRSPAAIIATFAALARHVYLPRGACMLAGEDGGALWFDRNRSKQLPPLAELALALRLSGLAGPQAVARAIAVDKAMTRRRPKEAHHYLFAVGVRPHARGRGLAHALLAPMMRSADEAGAACWLENTNPRNDSFYRGLGFEAVETFAPAADCPRVTTMRRAPVESRNREL